MYPGVKSEEAEVYPGKKCIPGEGDSMCKGADL